MCDGTSLSILVNDFLSFYDRIDRAENFSVEALPLLDAPLKIEDPYNRFASGRKFQEEFQKYYKSRSKFDVLMPFDKSKYYEFESTPSGIIRCRGSAKSLQNLVQHCRESRITVGAVLMATFTFALAKIRKSAELR